MANINDNEKSSVSQCKQIAAWLEKGNSITQLEALKWFHCLRLASRINDLRDRGMNIQKEMITTSTGKKVARYFIPKKMSHSERISWS